MRYVKVKHEQAKYFSWLDPFGYLDHITLPGYFAIGQLEEDEDITNMVSGLMICVCAEDAIVIEWLCVDPGRKSMGRGEGLLLQAYEIANDLDKRRLCVLMSSHMELGSVCNNAKSFFEERLFEKEESLIGEWNVVLDSLGRSEWLSRTGKLPETRSVRDVPPGVLFSFLNSIPEYGEAYKASLMGEVDLRTIEPSLSRVIMDGEEVCGMLLVQKAEDGLWPLFLYVESDNETKALIRDSYKAAHRSFAADTDVWVRIRSKEVGELLESLVPKKITNRYLLVANVSDFRS